MFICLGSKMEGSKSHMALEIEIFAAREGRLEADVLGELFSHGAVQKVASTKLFFRHDGAFRGSQACAGFVSLHTP